VLKIESNLDRTVRKLERVARNFPAACKRVVGTLRRKTGTRFSRSAAKVYNVKKGRIDEDVKVSGVIDAGLAFTVTGRKKQISFGSYGARQTRRGLSVKILIANGRKVLSRGFIARGVNGATLPFERVGPRRAVKAGRYRGQVREAIEAKHGPSVADMSNNPKVSKPVEAEFHADAKKELERVIESEIQKRG
jgi:hypothetical protein